MVYGHDKYFTLSVHLESDVYIRQILTSKVGPRTARVRSFPQKKQDTPIKSLNDGLHSKTLRIIYNLYFIAHISCLHSYL